MVRKLERLGPLSGEERRVLEALPLTDRWVEADRDLVREDERPSHCLLLLEGLACRSKALEDGRRQITAFHVPGDIPDLSGLLLGEVDQSVSALTPVRVAAIPHTTILGWTRPHPNLVHLLWRDTMIDAAISREGMVNLGRRTAYQRTAHLLCELMTRLRAVGLAQDHGCGLPITQAKLADALGLSAVHVNRTLQELRAEGLIELDGGLLVARDWAGLTRAAGFDPAYLHRLARAA